MTLEELQISGSFRPSRHGHLLRVVPPLSPAAATAPVLVPENLAIPEWVLVGLGDAGQRFVSSWWRGFDDLSGTEMELVRQAGRALDDSETAPTVRDRAIARRLFASLVDQLERRSK